jgi:predicted PurR-regulated permease PerM
MNLEPSAAAHDGSKGAKLSGGPEATAVPNYSEAGVPPAPRAAAAPDGPAANKEGAPDPIEMTTAHVIIIALGAIAFLYVARPVVLPVLLAWLAAMTLQPLVRCMSCLRLPAPVSAAVVFCLLVAAIGAGFFELERPAARWLNEAPQHMTELRQRVQKIFPKAWHFGQATAAVGDLGATEAEKKEEQRKTPMVEVKDQRGTSSVLNWTGTFLAGLGEVLVLIYLLLASGDLFLQKLVRLIPTLRGKIRAVEISHEIQQNISNYLFSISLINACLGALVSAGLYLIGVPNAGMWGIFVAFLNFIPYFGAIGGVVVLTAVGLLTFDSPWRGLLAPLLYMVLHLLEANLITPILLGRRFTLNPVAIFVSLIFWIWLWGVPGALLSVPILVSIKVVCDRIPAISAFGELIGR